MTWFADSSNQAAAVAAHAKTALFVDLDFASGHVRAHTLTGTIAFGGNDYLGVGTFGGIDTAEEDAELRPLGLRLTLSGVDASLVTTAMAEDIFGRDVTVYLGLFNTSTHALIATPETVFRGVMESMTVALGRNTGTITVSCESEMARWSRPRGLAYTHESQQLIYAGDKGLDQVSFLQSRIVTWDKRVNFNSFSSGGGSHGDGDLRGRQQP